jgi:predicted nuclease of predicted toxin-antitoxin system
VRLLRRAGFEVVCLKEIAPQDTPDEELLRIATTRSMVLLTNDKDFCDVLRYPPAAYHGLIVLRITPASETQVHDALLHQLGSCSLESLRGSLVVVSARKYRVRR